jgi:UDP-N-acetylmuramoyl-tripeptide--D-alanyl-D-alanine ligase
MKTDKNFNGQIGLPLSLFSLDKSHQVGILEMGISKFGEMHRLSNIARPNKAVITNIGLSHIENLKSQENICREKLHIADNFKTSKDDRVFINGDDPILNNMTKNIDINKVSFGFSQDNDFIARDIHKVGNNTYFTLLYNRENIDLCIPALGEHNVYNALAAIAVATDLGLSIEEIKLGLKKYKGIAMRQQIHKLEDNITVIDDSYNASPDSMRSAIKTLVQISNRGRKIAVLGDMLELGEYAEKEHIKLGEFLSGKVDIVLAVGDLSKNIVTGIEEKNSGTPVFLFSATEEAILWLKNYSESYDTILVKGSRGMHMDEVVKSLVKI